MSTFADDINSQISAGRMTIQRSLQDVQKQIPDRVPREVIVASGIAAVVMAVGVGWMIYRNRRRRTLVQKLRDVLPESLSDLPDDLKAKAKKPLERAVKAL